MMNNSQGASSFFSGLSTLLGRPHPLLHNLSDTTPPSLVVLDLGLPNMNGIEILEWMAEWDWLVKIPVIVFTASEDPEHERSAYALGVRRYMRKPEVYGALVEAVKEELRLRTETQQREAGA